MMERIREGTNSLAVKIILSLIIFSFVFAGVGSYLAGGNDIPAAKVGDQEISRQQLDRAYQNERAIMQQQAGEVFTALMGNPDYVQRFRQNILDRMVNDVLIEQKAAELGLRASDDQIKQAIRNLPEFQRDGRFNNDLYQAGLRRAGYSSEQFAEYMRQQLVRQQLINALQGSEFVLNSELESTYELEAQTRTVRSLTLPVSDFIAKVDVTEQEMKDYYESNTAQFIRPEQVKVAYVELTGEDVAEVAEVTEDEIVEFYEANKAKYGVPERRKVSHILVQGKGTEAKEKAEAFLSELQNGADFNALAQEKSEDTFSAKNGGSLNWIEPGAMDSAFEEAAFALANTGDISDVVQSNFGFHIIRLDDVTESDLPPLEEKRDEIVAQLKLNKAADGFYKLSSKFAKVAFEQDKSLEPAAEAINAEVKHTEYFALEEAEGLMANSDIQAAITSFDVQEKGLNSELIELAPEHVVVLRLEDTKPQAVLPFEDVESTIETTLATQEATQLAQQEAETLLVSLRDGSELSAEYSFSNAQDVGRISADRSVSDLAFTLAKPDGEAPTYGLTTKDSGDVVLVALDKVNVPAVPEISLDSQMASRMVRTSANLNLASTLALLRSEAEVTYPAQNVEQ